MSEVMDALMAMMEGEVKKNSQVQILKLAEFFLF